MRVDHMVESELNLQADAIANAASGKEAQAQKVQGVLVASAAELRAISDEAGRQAFCLFDDPVLGDSNLPDNPAHAVLVQSANQETTEIQGLRGELLDIMQPLVPIARVYGKP